MPRRYPPFVYPEKSRHGKVTIVFRRGRGPRTRMPDDVQSQEFKDVYEKALTGSAPIHQSRTKPNTLAWLVERHMESAKWASLSPATRKQRGLMYQRAIENSQNAPYAHIDMKAIQRSMEAKAQTPGYANNWLKSMRALFQWSVKNGHVEADPTQGVDRFKYKTDGFTAWTKQDAVQFCEYWPVGTSPRLAFELFLSSGLRRGDVHRIGPQHVKNGILNYRAQKNGALITVQLPTFLLETIRQTQTGDMAFMIKGNGEPFTSKESFGNWFSARCREAGLEKGKSAHGIRKLAATVAAEEGATAHELMAHFGWSTSQQAEIYTRKADRARLGLRSSARVEERLENMTTPTLNPKIPTRK